VICIVIILSANMSENIGIISDSQEIILPPGEISAAPTQLTSPNP
jgi:hypothetical protein